MKNFLIIFIALLNIFSCSNTTWSATNKNVLILSSTSCSREKQSKGIQSVLTKTLDKGVKITREYPGSLMNNPDYELFAKKLSEKYSSTSFDLVITSDTKSLHFALMCGNKFLKDVPVVFCGINQFNKSMFSGKKNITGVVEQIDIKETLNIALRMHPKTWRVYVINDSTISDINYIPALKNSFSHFQNKTDFILLTDVTKNNVLKKIKTIPDDSIILMLSCLKHESGKIINCQDSIRLVSANTAVAVYGINDSFLGYGLTGGKITSSFDQGRKAAEQAKLVLKGKNINSIPLSDNDISEFMFDYNELKKFNIKKTSLPKNSIIINKPQSLFRFNSKLFISLFFLILTQMTVIIFLIRNLTRTKKIKTKLQGTTRFLEEEIKLRTKKLHKIRTQFTESTIKYAKLNNLLTLNEEKHRMLFDASGEAVIIIHNNRVEDCNKKAQELYQFEKENLLGMDIDEFFGFFGPYKKLFTKIVSKTNSFTIKRKKNNVYECYSSKKDGGMFYAELVFSPIIIDTEIHIQLIIRDITSRKKIEENVVSARRLLEAANKHAGIESILDDFSSEILNMQKEATVGICLINNQNQLVCSGNKLCRTLGIQETKPKECTGFCMKYAYEIQKNKEFRHTGSFFTSNIKKDLEKFPDSLKKHMIFLNEKFGYVSMAVIPIKNDNLINGFIRVMDTKQINSDKISMLENVAIQLQTAWQRAYEEKDRHDIIVELEHAKKQEAIGSLSTGLIHEINTPLQFVGDNIEFLSGAVDDLLYLVDQYKNIVEQLQQQKQNDNAEEKTKILNEEVDLEFLRNELPVAVRQSQQGVLQVSKIVTAMKEFSICKSNELTLADINKAISNIIIISNNQWKYTADIKTNFATNLPPIPCYIGQISHMILILILNSISSIKKSGQFSKKQIGVIKVKTFQENNQVVIQISDNGQGVPEHLKNRIFDPFFSIKEYNEDFGQGLSLAYEIAVKKHNGSITVAQNTTTGAVFTVKLPVEQLENKHNQTKQFND